MKKIIATIFLGMVIFLQLPAQTRLRVQKEVRSTMNDFMSDLSIVNEDRKNSDMYIRAIADNYGSPDYFLYNGKQMKSFDLWIKNYCMIQLHGMWVEHAIDILEQTFRKGISL